MTYFHLEPMSLQVKECKINSSKMMIPLMFRKLPNRYFVTFTDFVVFTNKSCKTGRENKRAINILGAEVRTNPWQRSSLFSLWKGSREENTDQYIGNDLISNQEIFIENDSNE